VFGFRNCRKPRWDECDLSNSRNCAPRWAELLLHFHSQHKCEQHYIIYVKSVVQAIEVLIQAKMDDVLKQMREMENRMHTEMADMDRMMDACFRQDRDTLDEFFYLTKLGAFPTSRHHLIEDRAEEKAEKKRSKQIQFSFQEAVRQGDSKKVGTLLTHQLVLKIDLPYTYGGHETNALIDACSRGHTQVVRLLIEHGADVNQRVGSQTPLYMAAKNGHGQIVEQLLEHGAEVEPRMGTRRNSAVAELPGGSLFRDTPLHAAIRYLPKTARTLYPLVTTFCSCRQHHSDVISALLGRGASILSPDYAGETPMSLLHRWAGEL
jgi:hypothetical protein